MTRTVLIVEDGDDVTPLEIALAALKDVTVVTLVDGRDALEFLRVSPNRIGVVVTDLHLPRLDGFELIKAIRSDERYSRLPIVVVSGDGRLDLPQQLRTLGANAFFPKPYSPAEIRHVVKELLHAP